MKRVFAALLILSTATIGYFLGAHHTPPPPLPATAQAKKTYVCPMHSHIVRDHPGPCPICGMDLVETGTPAEGPAQVQVDAATQQKLGVRLASVRRETLSHVVRAYAMVVAQESASARITPTVEGMIQTLRVQPGQRIEAGQTLAELSSPEALLLQYDYVDLVLRLDVAERVLAERREQNRKMLAEMSQQGEAALAQAQVTARQSEEQAGAMVQPMHRDRERLILRLKQLGFTDAMIAQVAKSRQAMQMVPVRAPRDCVVKEVLVRPRMSVSAMTDMLTCVDSGRAALEVTLYPDQLNWASNGDRMTVELSNGKTFETRLAGLDALLDPASRTVRARVPLPPGVGRIGDYVDVDIHSAPRTVLTIPAGALLRTGHGDFALRALEHGHFQPVPVQAGIESDGRVAIRDGLSEGDQVVVNGQFLLDSAASIADAAQRMQAQGQQ